MTAQDVIKKAARAKGKEIVCPVVVILTHDGRAVREGDNDGYTVFRKGGETLDAGIAEDLGLLDGEAWPEFVQPEPEKSVDDDRAEAKG